MLKSGFQSVQRCSEYRTETAVAQAFQLWPQEVIKNQTMHCFQLFLAEFPNEDSKIPQQAANNKQQAAWLTLSFSCQGCSKVVGGLPNPELSFHITSWCLAHQIGYVGLFPTVS